MSTQRFQGKIAFVTGGNSGIGLAAAQGFAKEGARVAIAGRDLETLKQAKASLGANAIAVQADVSKLADIDRAIAQVKKDAGRIDALFVNAGVAHFAPIEASDEAFFDNQFTTNVKGAYFTIQKALPLMPKGSAIVINASSVVNMGMPNSSVYTATKAAIASLARSLAQELAPRGIRLNIVNPGPIETPIFGRMGLPAETTQAMAGQILSQVPLQRFGSPEDVARAVLFLSSDEAAYIHGASLGVDGGMSSL
ncbi:MAG: glucose 1-dehydrogenase [Planctomycetota bacterium]|nr:glucose 1-dehydrogenase [Planctomycetota bacterium]